jgi:small subunit ribosomal protein S4
MSRYLGPRLRIIRRLKLKQTLRGLTRKKTFRKTLAGQHCKKRIDPFFKKYRKSRKKNSLYKTRLEEKQKLRFNYGVTESQLVNYIRKAKKFKTSTGTGLLQLLEMRLDTILFRLSLAPTIPAARQLVNHGHVIVNNKKVNIPSYQCQPKDTIAIAKKASTQKFISKILNKWVPKKLYRNPRVPKHLILNKKELTGLVKQVIDRKVVQLPIKERLVVEFYSRKV